MSAVKHTSRFEWLKEYRDLHDEIMFLRWRLRKANAEADRWVNGDLFRVRTERGSNSARLPKEIAKLKKSLRECEAEQKELLELIETFQGDENTILRLKYIEGLTLDEIAEKVHRSPESVRKIHAELHRRLDYLDNFNEVQLRLEQRKDFITAEDKEAERDSRYYD